MIIVLSGGKQHGKDSFAKAVQDTHPELRFQRRAFADRMKEFACGLLGCTLKELEELKVLENCFITDAQAISNGTTMRKFLQFLGQYVKDLTHNNLIWCELLTESMLDKNTNYIVTDCRFDFEAEFIRDLAISLEVPCEVIKVENPNVAIGVDSHVSEQSFNSIRFDRVILNDGTLPELALKAIKCIEEIKGN